MCEDGAPRCRWQARFLVTIHPLHNCEPDKANNIAYRLCEACTRAAAYRIGEIIGQMYEEMPDDQAGQELSCRSCGCRVMELHDVFSVEDIVGREPAK